MAQRPTGGITGVLGELISPAATPAVSSSSEHRWPADRQSDPENSQKSPASSFPRCARVGRPPGSSVRHAGLKEKVTLRINSDMIAAYRDWSWEARCQMGELVERALVDYHEQHRSQQRAGR